MTPATITPSPEDTALARQSSQQLDKLLDTQPERVQVRIQPADQAEEAFLIPPSAARLLATILAEMARGDAVTVLPMHAELTTQQAADLLNVSRPFLIELLEQQALPFRKVGTHRRVLLGDVLAYKQQNEQARRQVLADLSALDQELGLGY